MGELPVRLPVVKRGCWALWHDVHSAGRLEVVGLTIVHCSAAENDSDGMALWDGCVYTCSICLNVPADAGRLEMRTDDLLACVWAKFPTLAAPELLGARCLVVIYAGTF